ncbi:MAG: type II toxin-antitoxin system RelE/ParE family toxin [Candidatus Micrarchaeota archaeon]
MYSIVFIDSSQKEFRQLGKENQKRVISVLERVRVRPFEFALRLSGSKAYRVRAGKLRIILDIREEDSSIVILKIGNRESIYLP